MPFFFAFLLQCKRIARRKGTLISFALLPALVLLLGFYLPRDAAANAIQVGIYLPENAPAADDLRQAILRHADTHGYALAFVPAESPDQVADLVAAGAWECGYLFPADFRQRLRAEDYQHLVTRVESPATTLAPLVNEAVSAAILDVCAPDIALAYMAQSGMLPEGMAEYLASASSAPADGFDDKRIQGDAAIPPADLPGEAGASDDAGAIGNAPLPDAAGLPDATALLDAAALLDAGMPDLADILGFLGVSDATEALDILEQIGPFLPAQTLNQLYGALLPALIPQFFDSSMILKAEIEFIREPGGAGAGTGAGSGAGAGAGAGSDAGAGSGAGAGAGAGSDAGAGAGAGTGAGAGSGAGFTVPALLRGLIALFLFLYSCLCSIWFIGDCRSGFYRRMAPYRKPGALYLPHFCAAALFAGAECLLALLLADGFFPGAFSPLPTEALSLLFYLIYLSAISYFLTGLLRRQEPLAAAMPFLLIACLLFCPIMIDLGRYIPVAEKIAALLPPTLYLRISSSLGSFPNIIHISSALRSFLGYLIAAALLYVAAEILQARRISRH